MKNISGISSRSCHQNIYTPNFEIKNQALTLPWKDRAVSYSKMFRKPMNSKKNMDRIHYGHIKHGFIVHLQCV